MNSGIPSFETVFTKPRSMQLHVRTSSLNKQKRNVAPKDYLRKSKPRWYSRVIEYGFIIDLATLSMV